MRFKQVHFVGIGGAGMSALAKICLEKGHSVTGSDLKESQNTLSLMNQGAQVFIGHSRSQVGPADVVVYSSAIAKENPELKEAKKRGVPLFPRGKMLSLLSQGKTLIAVAGTHGKTTTTSMLAMILEKSGLSPIYVVGGELNDIGTNAKWGRGKFFVTETDESDGSFLFLEPNMGVITNIEADHLDYYGSLERIEKSFFKFTRKVKKGGLIIACGDYPNVQKVLGTSSHRKITYGLKEENQFWAKLISLTKFKSSFEVFNGGKNLGKIKLQVPGLHNVYNALAALSLTLSLGISFEKVAEVLKEFKGVKRRYQILKKSRGITFIDDYAHHPTEVNSALKTAKLGKWKRIICLFQPHRYSRTKFLKDQFSQAFTPADLLILTEVYPADEEPMPGITGKLLVDAVLEKKPRSQVVYLPHKNEIKSYLSSVIRSGDLVLTLGAGDISMVAEELADAY